MVRGNPAFSTGLPEMLILRLLKEREMYGYEIVQAIRAGTQDALAPGEGVVYPLLHALEKQGLLKARRRMAEGRSRIYYALTARGARRLEGLAGDWTRMAEAVRAMLKGPAHAV